jgi:hypothetical protein
MNFGTTVHNLVLGIAQFVVGGRLCCPRSQK